MTDVVRVLTDEEWQALYDPMYDGCCLGPMEDVPDAAPEFIWTQVEESDRLDIIRPGFWHVNCVGYYVTAKSHGFEKVMVSLPSFGDDEDDEDNEDE